MKCARIWFLLALLPLLAGCFPKIFSEQPLGEPAVLDPRNWNGYWLGDDGKWTRLLVVDADTLLIGPSNTCDPSSSEATERVHVRQSEGWYFAERGLDKSGSGTVNLYETHELLRVENRTLYVFLPNDKRAMALVEQGELPGRIENGQVVLGALTPEQHEVLFQVKEFGVYPRTAKDDIPYLPFPMATMIKLPDDLDPCKKDAASK